MSTQNSGDFLVKSKQFSPPVGSVDVSIKISHKVVLYYGKNWLQKNKTMGVQTSMYSQEPKTSSNIWNRLIIY